MRKKLLNLWPCAASVFAVPLMYTVFRAFDIAEKAAPVRWFLCTLIAVALVYLLVLLIRKGITEKKLIYTVIFIGVVLRIGYTLVTGAEIRSHDIGEISPFGYGHAGYILHILTEGKLPESYAGQFYQQPLFYVLGAGISSVVNGFLGVVGHYELVDAAKLISCMASCIMLFLIKPICRVCGIGDKGTLTAVTLTAFTPSLILSGGRVNPDMLATMFMTAAILYTLKVYKDQSLKNFLILALIYGLGVQTKISCGTVAIFTAVVFVVLLYKANSDGRFVDIGGKLIVFAIIALPLGLWYSFRNFIMFRQPFTYVPLISAESEIYVGDRSFFSRFFSIDLQNLFQTPYADPWSDYNLPVYLQKTALFGEFKYGMNDFIPVVLLFCGSIMSILAVVAVIRLLTSKNRNIYILSLCAVFLLQLVSTVMFNINYPHGCSMDFRYLLILLAVVPPVIGKIVEDNEKLCKLAVLPMGIYAGCSTLFIIFM